MAQKRSSDQQSADDTANRAAKRAGRAPAAKKEADELRGRRLAQLEDARVVVGTLEEMRRELRERSRRRSDLADHLDGFYEEVDKLAKGKAMLEVTPLILAGANQIISDAKEIVTSDTYLDRVKEFVPAGNNPVYPDVVVALRTVRQTLERAARRFQSSGARIKSELDEATTVSVGLELYLEANEVPSLPTVAGVLGDPDDLHEGWFTPSQYGAQYRKFDVDRLDEIESLDDYFSVEDEE